METLLEANTYHNADNIERIKKFAGMLPGVADLNLFATSSITTGWKWVVFWMVQSDLSYLDSHVTRFLLCCLILYDSKVRTIRVAPL